MGARARRRKSKPLDAYERNAQHGQNRAGVDVAEGEAFDEWESALPIDPKRADERVADEGDEIRARVHARGHDVLDED
jgi:hypothetical protein